MAGSPPAFAEIWRRRAQRFQTEAHFFYFVLKHRNTRWYAKLVAACAAGYLLSPVQLIPNFIPVIGCMDDLLVLFVGAKLLQKISPSDVLSECRALAEAAEARRNEEIRSTAAVITSVAIVIVWLLAGVTVSAFMAAYTSR
jgi:uncharacterized membrane protein YkvA (DUF1232 family)